jgi:hypothetical protein
MFNGDLFFGDFELSTFEFCEKRKPIRSPAREVYAYAIYHETTVSVEVSGRMS